MRAAGDAARIVRAFHERTKHALERYAPGPQGLDWATQPDPFRRFEGSELVELDLVPPTDEPRYHTALVLGGSAPAPLDRGSVSQLLQDSLALSAWKEVGAARWSLRVNPSSGNLHPTEAYLLAGAIPGLAEGPAVWHYAPREHALERRAEVPGALWGRLVEGLPPGSLLVGLTTIFWRESWKYGERAFRYCNHDAGHALAALSIAAAALGWRATLADGLGGEELAALLGVRDMDGPEAEHPECLLVVRPAGAGELAPAAPAPAAAAAFEKLPWHGRPSSLSPAHVAWDAIDAVAAATAKPPGAPDYLAFEPPGNARALGPAAPPLRRLVHGRRSAVAMDGETSLSRDAFLRAMEACMPRTGRVPFDALPWSPRIHLAVFVHRVEGLEPGLYWLARDPARLPAARAALGDDFRWERVPGAPEDLPLQMLLPADLRGPAETISCHQSIAAMGAFSLGMMADFERSLAELGPWFYPRLFWECGAVGQALYLAAEALGVAGTGIGCFFDDAVHGMLGLRRAAWGGWQSLYHFTVGAAVEDPRLVTRAAYPER